MITALCVVAMLGLCVLLAWGEHRYRLGEAVERAVIIERRRVSAYLREQSRVAEVVGSCKFLSELGREQEKYAAAVLEESAAEIAECHHLRVRP